MKKLETSKKVSCIYQIRNLVNNHIYVGSTNNLYYRQNYHINHLKKKDHPNIKLQRAYNKYREDNFVLEVLITCDQSLLFWYEQQFLDKWNPEYNISKNAEVPTRRGEHLSKKHANNISKALTGRVISDYHKLRMSQGQKGKKFSEETHKLWSQQRMGHEKTAKLHKGLIAPDGTIYKDIFNMAKFCREHNLDKGRISDLELGRAKFHKNWTLLQEGIL